MAASTEGNDQPTELVRAKNPAQFREAVWNLANDYTNHIDPIINTALRLLENVERLDLDSDDLHHDVEIAKSYAAPLREALGMEKQS